MTLPNFLIIGAARSGTSALAEFLRQHPEIFFCEPKEPHFFSFENQVVNFKGTGDDIMMNQRAITSLDKFTRLFEKAQAKAIGEGSVSSLYYHDRSIPSIQRHVPDARMILLLRNPIDRAYSSYLYMRARGHEKHESFLAALDDEASRIRENWHHIWHYTQMGFYSKQIQAFIDAFGRDKIKIYLHEDLKKSPEAMFRDLFGFLGVDTSFSPKTDIEINRSGEPKSKLLHSLIRGVVKRPWMRSMVRAMVPRHLRMRVQSGNLARNEMSEEARVRLSNQFRDEIHDLSKVLQRDVTPWIDSKPATAIS